MIFVSCSVHSAGPHPARGAGVVVVVVAVVVVVVVVVVVKNYDGVSLKQEGF